MSIWNLMSPWEFHPALIHFPIAFLIGGVLLDLYVWWRSRVELERIVTGLLITGVLTGIIAALSGLVAFFTVPAHTEEAHTLMYWHLGLAIASLVVFSWVVISRWRTRHSTPAVLGRLGGLFAALLLVIAAAIGGQIVYRGGAGVDPRILSPEIREGHSHATGHHEQPSEEHLHDDTHSGHMHE